MNWIVTATWLTFLEGEEEIIEVEAEGAEEAKVKARPRIDELSEIYGRGPGLVSAEKSRGFHTPRRRLR